MNAYAGAVLDQLDRLFNRGTVAGLNEGALLERYVSDGDEAAFAALVARHGPMVLGVCRRVLRDERDVEDAFQATFLVLVRRAGAIRDRDLVGRWLHGVAHRVAVRARAHSAHRFVHEQSVSEPIEAGVAGPASGEAERRELAAIVDEEVTRLPSTLRAPVVLCYLEGMTHDEAARHLRWPVGTVRSRMARGRDVLRHRLALRGVSADGAALVTALARPPVPPEWLDATVRGSLNFATHPATAAAIASARSVAIAKRVLQTMVIAKLSYIAAAGLGLVLTLGGVRTLAFQDQGGANPIGLASPSRKSGGQDPAPKDPADAKWDAFLQIEILQVEIHDREAQIKGLNEQIAALKERLAARRKAIDADGGARRPAPARPASSTPIPPTPAVPPTPLGLGDEGRPHYVQIGDYVVVFSAGGRKVAAYYPQTGKARSIPLPPISGSRREFLVMAKNPYPVASRKAPGAIETVPSPWFFALDLDRVNMVHRLSAFNALDGTYIGEEIDEPVDRSSVKTYGHTVFGVGRRIYALSTDAKRWGMLEWPPGLTAKPFFQGNTFWAEKDGRLFRFNYATGNWEDIYAQAIGAEPAEPAR